MPGGTVSGRRSPGILVRRTGDFETCEDAIQEALLAASRQWPVGPRPQVEVPQQRGCDSLGGMRRDLDGTGPVGGADALAGGFTGTDALAGGFTGPDALAGGFTGPDALAGG